MKSLVINPVNVRRAAAVLKQQGVIVYPTDTAYALGGVFDSPAVRRRILQIKQRRDEKFTLIAASLAQVQQFFTLNTMAKKLARKFWPGPLSIVVTKQFAVRVPKQALARSFARQAGRPLIATSANLSGSPAPYTVQAVLAQFKNKKNQPDLLLDAGRLKKVKPSTVVAIVDGQVRILRAGPVRPIID